MFKHLAPYFTQSRKGHAAITAAACLIALVAAPASGAAVPSHPGAFTITAMKASSGAPARVLATDAEGRVELQRPSGAPGQRWVVTTPYGAQGATTLVSYVSCLERLTCPFTNPEPSAARSLVNQATGQCLSFSANAAGVPRVANCDAGEAHQQLTWNFGDAEIIEDGVPQRYTALAAQIDGRLRCLASPKVDAAQSVRGGTCTSRRRWEQQYRFTPVN